MRHFTSELFSAIMDSLGIDLSVALSNYIK